MRTIPDSFTRQRVFYDLVKRVNNVAIYSLRYSRHGRIVGHDIFLIPRERERVLDGRTLSGGDGMPRNKAWGRSAWSYTTLAAAENKRQEVLLSVEK